MCDGTDFRAPLGRHVFDVSDEPFVKRAVKSHNENFTITVLKINTDVTVV